MTPVVRYAVQPGRSVPTFQGNLMPLSCGRIMETGSSETSVHLCHTAQCDIPWDGRSLSEILLSREIQTTVLQSVCKISSQSDDCVWVIERGREYWRNFHSHELHSLKLRRGYDGELYNGVPSAHGQTWEMQERFGRKFWREEDLFGDLGIDGSVSF